MLLLGRDISRRVRAGQAQLDFQAKVLEAQRRESLGILAGSIAHEFSNMMMAILGGTSLALTQLPESSPARARLVQVEKPPGAPATSAASSRRIPARHGS